MQLGFEFLINHGTDEVIEAEIVLLLAGFIEGRLRIGCTFELGLKTKAVLIEKGTLLIGGCIRELIDIDEGRCAFCCFAKMLKMSKFIAFRRGLLVIALVFLKIDFRVTCFCERAICVMQMFEACDELVLGVESSCDVVNASRIMNFSHIVCILWF